jgi:hypothetical protein
MVCPTLGLRQYFDSDNQKAHVMKTQPHMPCRKENFRKQCPLIPPLDFVRLYLDLPQLQSIWSLCLDYENKTVENDIEAMTHSLIFRTSKLQLFVFFQFVPL